MSTENRIRHLEEEHHKLDKKIDGLESTGVFDDAELATLKKQRLRIKTELVTLIQEHREPVYKTEQK
jgi:uncharacterized protein YdcH (DUF465 family)